MFEESRVLRHLDKMLDEGINGTFEESDYDETKLSKLESKWLRYLSSSKMSYQKTMKEREKLQELVSDISHQTKTPLANILLYSQLLQEKKLDDECCQLVDEIRKQSEKLEFLIQSLVKTSRLETGTFQLSPAVNDVNDMISAALEQIAPAANHKEIIVRYNPQTYTARFDKKWTQEALFNILDNAVKYSPPHSEIVVTTTVYEMYTRISVSDSGMGIPEDELPRIFGRFYRGQDVSEQSGVGIGLYLSRQIIESQDGYITAKSAKDKGSTFNIFLPK